MGWWKTRWTALVFVASHIGGAAACGGVVSVSPGSDAGAMTDASPGSLDASAEATLVGFGGVYVSTDDWSTGPITVAGAEFTVFASQGTDAGLTSYQSGDCTVVVFPLADAGAGDAGLDLGNTSAGAITVTGGAFPLALTPAAGGTYADDDENAALWTGGGQRLTMTAQGAVAPAFSRSLVAPASVSLVAPSVVEGPGLDTLTVLRNQDLSFSWTGGTVGNVTLTLFSLISEDVSASCTFPVSSGAGTMPASLLAHFPPDPDATFFMEVTSETTFVRDGWSIDLMVSRSVDQSGLNVIGTANIE
jgi:hypothetical protein